MMILNDDTKNSDIKMMISYIINHMNNNYNNMNK